MGNWRGTGEELVGNFRNIGEQRLVPTIIQRDLLEAQRAQDGLQLLGFLLDAENRVFKGLAGGRQGCPGGQGGRSGSVED